MHLFSLLTKAEKALLGLVTDSTIAGNRFVSFPFLPVTIGVAACREQRRDYRQPGREEALRGC